MPCVPDDDNDKRRRHTDLVATINERLLATQRTRGTRFEADSEEASGEITRTDKVIEFGNRYFHDKGVRFFFYLFMGHPCAGTIRVMIARTLGCC